MLRTRAVIEQIKSGTPEQRESAKISLGSALLFGCFPLLLTFFLLGASRHLTWVNFKPLFLNGDLLMLTNATVAAASMLIGKERRNKERFPGGDLFLLMGAALLTGSAALFFMLKLFDVLEFRDPNNYWLSPAVIFIFVGGVLYSYFVVLLDTICDGLSLDPEGDFDRDAKSMQAKRAARKRTNTRTAQEATQ